MTWLSKVFWKSDKVLKLEDRIAVLEEQEKLLVKENNNLRAAIRAAKNILDKEL